MLKKMSSMMMVTVFVMLLCQTIALAAQRNENSVEPQYTHIAAITGSFDIKEGKALCYASGRSRYADTTTVVRITLQRRSSGTNTWAAVCSWSESAAGKETARVSKEKTVTKGYDYRIYIKCIIKDSEGVIKETDSMHSRIVSY